MVKLGDYGAAFDFSDDDHGPGTVIGDRKTMAPEVKNRKIYDEASDIFSLGGVLFEMLYLKNYNNHLSRENPSDLKFEKRSGMSDEVYQLLKEMLMLGKLVLSSYI